MVSFFNKLKVKYYNDMGYYNLFKSFDVGMALHYFEKVLEIDENNVRALIGEGKALLTITRGIKGEKWLNKALEIDSLCLLALISKGDILEKKKNYEGAVECFEKALEVCINSKDAGERKTKPSIYAELSFQDLCLNNPQKAKENLENWINEYPNNSWLLINMGLALNMLSEYKEAISYFELAINNNDLNYYYDLHFIGKGVSLFHLKNYTDAIAFFDKAIKVKDNNPCSFYWKSKSLKALGNDEKAEKCCSQSKKLASDKFNFYKGNKTIFR